MFSGWKKSLEAAASQVLGNSISSRYHIGNISGSGGSEMLWTVYEAKSKSSGDNCSIFVFYKQRNYLGLKDRALEVRCLSF